ncbi:hypothetical protein G4228_012697 [Cervus hanglu yarkandensis]|nr:hypothetical protein G4228_012697 [Cervus hanglu yarkandensis]
MSGIKRTIKETDPDYEDVSVALPNKRHKAIENSARDAAVQKIETIIKEQFALEMKNKEHEIEVIDQRLIEARRMMDKLRACIVANYYASTGLLKVSEDTSSIAGSHKTEQRNTDLTGDETSRLFVKKTIVVGNVSKYIPPDKREENDQSTHKWMVYVRGSRREPSINHFVKKVWFFLHPSYKPNDLVEVREPPFHLTRRGWGEFPVRVQVHFKDSQNKRIDIIHNLKLDRTYTGLQTLGAETVVDVELHRHSLGEDSVYPQSSESDISDAPPSLPLTIPAPVKASSPIKQSHEPVPDTSVEKGSPISTPSPSPLPRTPTSTPVHVKQGTTSSVINNPYVIVDKPGQVIGASTPTAGSPTSKLSTASQASQGTGSPIPKIHGSSFVTSAVKVVGVPVGSTLPSTVKQAVAISGGQILVAKASSSVAKAVGPKQVVTQGVAKAIVSGGGGTIVAQPVQTLTKAQVTAAGPQKSGSQGSVMATLQLPATNLANLANLPPGTKLYLTTNSKNPSGKGKLLLIPQGAILRATNNANLQSGSAGGSGGCSSSGGGGGGSSGGAGGTSGAQNPAGPGGISQHLTYTSYILKQTPQGTFLVGQPSPQTSGKQLTTGSVVQGTLGVSTSSAQGQQTLKVISGQKTTLFTQSEGTTPGSSSTVGSVMKTSGQQQVCVSQATVGSCKAPAPSVISATSLVSTPNPISGKATVSGLLKIHSSQSNPQQAVLTIPSQLKPLSVNTSGGVQTILMPVNKVVQSFSTSKSPAILPVAAPTPVVPSPVPAAVTKVKTEPETPAPSGPSQDGQTAVKTEESSELGNYVIKIDHLETIQQLLTAVVKKIPLITAKSEDASCFSAKSVEQYYGWNIGKRRAAEWQRAMTMRKVLQEILEKNPRFHHLTPLKTKHIAHWCRCHGYTPPDPESLRSDGDSIEDVLTQIDSEPECPSSFSSADNLCRKLEDLQQFQKREPENEEEVDILNVSEPLKINIKKEQEEKQEEMKLYLPPTPGSEFIGDITQKIGITLQPVALHKNVYASVVEDMLLKATEQLVSDILRQALAVGYQAASHNRIPKEITVSNIHQAICNIPFLDFLTNKHMGILNEDK